MTRRPRISLRADEDDDLALLASWVSG